MNILHVVNSLSPVYGGPAVSVPSLCRELSYLNCNVYLLSGRLGKLSELEDYGKSTIIERKFNTSELLFLMCGKLPDLSDIPENIDIVHLHEIWPIGNVIIADYAIRKGIKLVVSPRSSLLPNDLNRTFFKQVKKWIAWNIYFKKKYQSADGMNATALNEFKAIKSIGFKTKAAIIPNGINIQEFNNLPDRDLFNKYFPKLCDKKILLFFSRIEPKKGLPLLSHAWGRLAAKFPEWHLLIAGPDENKHWKHVHSILNSYDLKDRYTYAGYLSGEARHAVLNAAQLFVLPTYWENFGIVIAEAMMAKTPVITTTETPWEQIVDENCGWIIKPAQDELTNVLNRALRMKDETLSEMGKRGHNFVRNNYNWKDLANKMKEFYEFILSRGAEPDFVYTLRSKNKSKLPFSKPLKTI